MTTKKTYLYDRFFVSDKNFITEHFKIVQNSRFFQVFFKTYQIPGFFYLNCQIPS